ncbi:hypothetical protein CFN78_06715 [Amycolatopsis antarctica]|uniref:HK97 gp10 family phage protein n=1 Tax=Amycolatopsis antarctica TaxID=1854586 RepID=A0A263D636_9PSEU|nr:hypothetical protein [Amycolatopsis antarctica]OZM73974.1 hypothetical protein CFN78_06715 [Amycolatopsis antarctica]
MSGLDGLDEAAARLVAGFERGIEEAATELKRLSQQQVPYDQGDLSRSAKVSTDFTGDRKQAAVSYDTVYAARQHEELEWRHQNGRKARYLGDPLRANAARLQQHIADQTRRASGG